MCCLRPGVGKACSQSLLPAGLVWLVWLVCPDTTARGRSGQGARRPGLMSEAALKGPEYFSKESLAPEPSHVVWEPSPHVPGRKRLHTLAASVHRMGQCLQVGACWGWPRLRGVWNH